jgi:hypothetical protein
MEVEGGPCSRTIAHLSDDETAREDGAHKSFCSILNRRSFDFAALSSDDTEVGVLIVPMRMAATYSPRHTARESA